MYIIDSFALFTPQVINYKEHVSKLKADLTRERNRQEEAASKVTEMRESVQPLKEKVKEYETVNKRLAGEKRSLEAQLSHAEAKMKEMRRQYDRQSFGVSVFVWGGGASMLWDLWHVCVWGKS